MLDLSNLTIEESRTVARLRNIDGYENTSTQELENVFAMLSASIPTPIPIARPRPRSVTGIPHPLRPRSRPICIIETLPI